MRKILFALLLMSVTLSAFSQSGTNSPYSQYGLGVLSDQSNGFNRGMNGLSLGMREHNQVNMLNPASYSCVDSLSFIFDIGASGQITSFKEGGKRLNANNGNFEYAMAAFRLFRHVGASFGMVPYSNVGYSFSKTEDISSDAYSKNTYTDTYSGSGGLHQVYFGMGWEIFKNFSLGANVSYLWGDIDRTLVNSYSDASVTTLSKDYNATVKNYKLDIGAQYTFKVGKENSLTVGATYSLGHKLNSDPECWVFSTPQTGEVDTLKYKAENALELPTTYGAGFTWQHGTQWKVGVDYSLTKWSSVVYPEYSYSGSVPSYEAKENMFNDRHKVTVGGEYCKRENGRSFFDRLHYRLGASYATSYLKINGMDGPKEYSVSMGFGIPIKNSWNSRSVVNISGQWVRSDSKQFITENSFRINLGITFNERWFAKWKVN